jgi:hypothetical protein
MPRVGYVRAGQLEDAGDKARHRKALPHNSLTTERNAALLATPGTPL